MKLKTKERICGSGSLLSKVRNEGYIPAVIYSRNNKTESIQVPSGDFEGILRTMEKGHLPTTVFELEFNGKVRKAVVKDIHYHKTSYKILHLDFLELIESQEVTLKVPLHFLNVAECSGIKLGGFLRQIIRHITVRCLPKHIPSAFTIDVKELGLNQAKRIKDIAFPKGVKCQLNINEVVVVIGK